MTALLDFFIFKNSLAISSFIGMALVVLGIVLVNKEGKLS